MARLIVGPSEPVIDEIRRAAHRHAGGRARVAVAWARDEGSWWLIDALGQHIANVQLMIGVNERGTTVEALLRLLPVARSLMVYFKHPRQTFHPKLYWFDDGRREPHEATLIIGSSNLTHGGLLTNFEASLVVEVGHGRMTAEDRQLVRAAEGAWNQFTTAVYAHPVRNVADVQQLYEAGHLVTETTLRRRQRQRPRDPGPTQGFPTAPPPRIAPAHFDVIAVPFPLRRETPAEPEPAPAPPPLDVDLPGQPPVPDRFFVRTLTPNDVEKLHGRTPGTFEPDLGQTARDRYPAFWGWPEEYQEIERQLPRQEWRTDARLISSRTPAAGIPITITFWFRPSRPGHAAEHRFGLGPIGDVRGAAPAAFDETSLAVVERAPEGGQCTFIVRFIARNDPGYDDFAGYLTEIRPHHRFGYGP